MGKHRMISRTRPLSASGSAAMATADARRIWTLPAFIRRGQAVGSLLSWFLGMDMDSVTDRRFSSGCGTLRMGSLDRRVVVDVGRMGIRTKFNLVLLAVAALAFVLFAFVAAPIFQAEKKEEILEQARLLMESAQAIRDYTSEEIAPVLDRLQDEKFYPQSVSAYAAVHYFEALHKKHPEFTYREPALNPTNPAHRAYRLGSRHYQRFPQ